MRHRYLQLIRFGHFSDIEVPLVEGGRAFHVIYGANEAGKSTALRAITDLLFGIPERTSDAFLHGAAKLRIGGELERSDGRRLPIVRRKGRKNTLLDVDEEPIDESRLAEYLGGVNRDLFEAMFGMNHQRLVDGGRDLLKGQGEVGETIFGAATGLRGLREEFDALEIEAGDLFKPRAQAPLLNKAIARHREARSRVKQLTLKPRDWEERRKDLDEARTELDRAREEHARNKARLDERKALQQALPDLREREDIRRRLEEMGEVVLLPDNAENERRESEERLRTAKLRTGKLADEAARKKEQLAELDVPEALLDEGPRTAALQDQRAIYVKATKDRYGLTSDAETREAEIARLMRELPESASSGDVDALRIDTAARARIRQMASAGDELQGQAGTLGKSVRSAAEHMAETKSALDALPAECDTAMLRGAVAAALRAGDLEADQSEAAAQIAAFNERGNQAIQALPMWSGSLAEAAALPLPSDETVERFESDFRQVDDAERSRQERKREFEIELEGLLRSLADLESTGEIPGPEDLKEARRHRDSIWTRIRGVWLEGRQDEKRPETMADDYESQSARADVVGDRMFAENERVVRRTSLNESRQRIEQSLDTLEEELERIGDRRADLQREWTAVWGEAGIEPRPPREMRSWKEQHRQIVSILREIEGLRKREDALGREAKVHRTACSEALADLTGRTFDSSFGLSATLEAAQALIRDAERAREERAQLENAAKAAALEKQKRTEELGATERELADWRERWGIAVSVLHLAPEAQPKEAEAVLEKLDQIFTRHDQTVALKKRIRHIDRDCAAFESALEEIIADACPDLPAMAPAERSAALLARVEKGREARTQREILQHRLQEIDAELQDIQREEEAAKAVIDDLRNRAGIATAEDLESAERRSREAQRLTQSLEQTEDRLRRVGRPFQELVDHGRETEEEELLLEIDRLAGAVESNAAQREEWSRKLADLERDFAEMDGGARAAEADAQAEEALAEVTHLTAEYARKRIAAMVLGWEIQRFSEENQGPILKRTSEIFRRMTLERYDGIKSDFSHDDEAIILCQRAGAEPVGVEGLSDGTRDQLYLSLRLAALEQHVQQHEPMPLIIDDVLVNFDDPRSAATLELMAELSQTTQILFFTHHERLVDLARKAIPEEHLAVHELERP